MKCAWCHNPETISSQQEILWKRRLCVQCGACADVCPTNAIYPPVSQDIWQNEESSYQKINRDICDSCMKCLDACKNEALCAAAKLMSISDILEEVEKDSPFYDNSGGGITVSGGEPVNQHAFTMRLLKEAKERGLHTCLDTSGHCAHERFERVVEHADITLFDLKQLDPVEHEKATQVNNARILKNLEWIAQSNHEVWIRIPVVPGFNDSMLFHKSASEYLAGLSGNIGRVDLLPFHNWCENKYDWLGLNWQLKELESMDPFSLESLAACYKEKGFFTSIGGSGFEENRPFIARA